MIHKIPVRIKFNQRLLPQCQNSRAKCLGRVPDAEEFGLSKQLRLILARHVMRSSTEIYPLEISLRGLKS